MFYHAPSRLSLTHYRAYSSDAARWLSRDPIGENGGINLYAYVEDSPVENIDPDGWCKADRCKQLKKQIFDKYGKLVDELRKYDPVADGKGGFPFRGGVTKPGGHYVEINNLKRGIVNDTTEYRKLGCDDDEDGGQGPIPRFIFDTVNQYVEPPRFPEPDSPQFQITPPSPSPWTVLPWFLLIPVIIFAPVGA